eukprot:TRINITY_DN4246_c0_g1_i1.p1 TRINITY_DN4246_c0_g1~~TRINITY_DN4246_c0_g1_i1.p1  ORF type:complete len:207 (-),score=14.19 TRINITY_DN4246_c0_g1_i1:65-685(-)
MSQLSLTIGHKATIRNWNKQNKEKAAPTVVRYIPPAESRRPLHVVTAFLEPNPLQPMEQQYYTAPERHPFKAELDAAQIPGGQYPDMLRYGLAENTDVTNKPSSTVIEHYNGMMSKNAHGKSSIIIGVSGCAKTRLQYEVLSKIKGCYFTASIQGNGGFEDMERLCTLLFPFAASPDFQLIVRHWLNCLLFASLILIKQLEVLSRF